MPTETPVHRLLRLLLVAGVILAALAACGLLAYVAWYLAFEARDGFGK